VRSFEHGRELGILKQHQPQLTLSSGDQHSVAMECVAETNNLITKDKTRYNGNTDVHIPSQQVLEHPDLSSILLAVKLSKMTFLVLYYAH
jgi:hypothetical protein